VIGAVSRVTGIMNEIAVASSQQSTGIDQVGQAIAQMDGVTQHNAALVEEATAAAQSLQDQALKLDQAVAVFKLNSTQQLARSSLIKSGYTGLLEPAPLFNRQPI